MSKAPIKCVCGHTERWHLPAAVPGGYRQCMTNRCMNVCDEWRPTHVLPAPGERPQFGVHRLPPAEADTAPAWDPMAVAKWADKRLRATDERLRRE